MSANVSDVDQADFNTAIIERSKTVPVVVDFWAEWCGPCKQLSPVLEKLADEYNGGFELAKIDVDANQALAQQMGVQGIPAVVAFSGGQPVDSFQGALPEPQVREWLDSFASPAMNDALELALQLLDRGDEAGAEKALRALLAETPDAETALTLATLYIDQNRMAEAIEVLEAVGGSPEADQLRSIAAMALTAGEADGLAAELESNPDDVGLQIRYAVSLAGGGKHEEALERLLDIVYAGGDSREDARVAMISIFDALGTAHPTAAEYRRRLANALY